MISKCSNIIINRTKFSEFEDFDISSQYADNLKLVGYIEETDPCSGETVKKNVAIKYSPTKVLRPSSYFIPDLIEPELNSEYVRVQTLSDGSISYHICSGFQGDMIQFNFNESLVSQDNGNGPFCDTGKYPKCFTISFDKEIDFGQEINILFKNFPIYIPGIAARVVDFTSTVPCKAGIQSESILFEYNDKFHDMWTDTENTCKPFNFLVTFNQTMVSSAGSTSSAGRKMVATNIVLVD